MTTELIINEKELAERQANWYGFAGHLYSEEIALQNACNIRVLQCTAESEIPEAERQISEAKKKLNEVIDRRKATTSVLDKLCDRLREPEKELEKYLNSSTALVTAQKRLRDARLAKDKQLIDERANVIMQCKNYKQGQIARINNAINSGVVKLIELALGSKIAPEKIQSWLKQFPFKPEKFIFTPPTITVNHIPITELQEIIKQHAWYNVNDFGAVYDEAISKQFSDYEVSYANAEQALINAKIEAEKKAAEEELKKAQAIAANALEQEATAVPFVSGIKRTFVIDMPDTFESATLIIKAFYANAAACRAHLRVKSYLKLGVDNMMVALAGMKNYDNNFSPDGIVWGIKEK